MNTAKKLANLPDTREGVRAYLDLQWLPESVAVVDALVDKGLARWEPDPHCAGVWGLHVKGDTSNQVRAIVYLKDGDDEADELWLGEQAATSSKGR